MSPTSPTTTPTTPNTPPNPSQLTSKASISMQPGNPRTTRKLFASRTALTLAGALLVGGLLVYTPGLHAQNTVQSTARANAVRQVMADGEANQQRPDTKHATELVTLNFSGGTLEEYIDALKKAMLPAPANVMVRGDASVIPIGVIELEDVPLANAMNMLGGAYHIENTYYQISVREYTMDKGRSAYTLEVSRKGQIGRQIASNQILVLSLKELTTALPGDPPEIVIPAETVLTSIETALSVADNQATKPEIRYHTESGLLIVSGTTKTLGIAKDVIETITNDIRERRDRARDLLEDQGLANPVALEKELADAKGDAELAQVELDQALKIFEIQNENHDEWVKITKDKNALFNSHIQIEHGKGEIEKLRIQHERAIRRVEQLEHALERSREIVSGGNTPDDEINALREENAMLRDRLEMLQAQLHQISAGNTTDKKKKDGDH